MEKKRILPKIKSIVIWAVKKPVLKISIVTDEEKLFLEHCHKFLDTAAIKPEHRKKE